jgi:hypothetical protein
MLADSGKAKADNVFDAHLSDGTTLRLLHVSMLYGANASGKSNFILALQTLKQLVVSSSMTPVGSPIDGYAPFLLDPSTAEAPSWLELHFVGPGGIRHCYGVKYSRNAILEERLDFFPHGQPANLFDRQHEPGNMHTVNLGKSLKGKRIGKKVFHNQLYLSKFGIEEPHEHLTEVFRYFQEMQVWNVTDRLSIHWLRNEITEALIGHAGEAFAQRLSRLMKIADTGIDSIFVQKAKDEDFHFPSFIPDEAKRQMIDANSLQAFARHTLYEQGKPAGTKAFNLDEESVGTKVLFALGGAILKVLDKGGIIFFDELDNSLHPKLSKFLVRLFQHPSSNPKHAQLVFATHEVTFLDKDVFRRDQIWFAEKSSAGATELFSISDIEGVREDVPFDKWYMNGKFGGQPKIKEIDFIFSQQTASATPQP